MILDLSPLGNAIARLDQGLKRYQGERHDTQIRDGLTLRLKWAYEQCHKMLRRSLEARAATPGEFYEADFQFIIRSANEQGLLLGDWPKWRGYRQMRAKTSHTYDEDVALEVVASIPAFLEEARYLMARLEQHHP